MTEQNKYFVKWFIVNSLYDQNYHAIAKAPLFD